MDKATELHHLQKRKRELDRVEAELADIRDWLDKNRAGMVSDVGGVYAELDAAMRLINSAWNWINDQASVLEDEIEEESAKESD